MTEFCWLMRDIKATPLLTIDQFMRCLESRMKYKTVALHFLWSNWHNFWGHRTSTEEAIAFSNAMPSSAVPAYRDNCHFTRSFPSVNTGSQDRDQWRPLTKPDTYGWPSLHIRMQTPRSAVGGRRTRAAFATIYPINRSQTKKRRTHEISHKKMKHFPMLI
jgi:hypothetical protein